MINENQGMFVEKMRDRKKRERERERERERDSGRVAERR
jgi:hypothetical protein